LKIDLSELVVFSICTAPYEPSHMNGQLATETGSKPAKMEFSGDTNEAVLFQLQNQWSSRCWR
jgi:hypothetical protein